MDLRYLTFVSPEPSSFRVALLVPELIQTEIERHYLPLLEGWRHRTIAIKLPAPGNSLKMAEKRAWAGELTSLMVNAGITHIAIADSSWFQAFSGKRDTAEKSLGYLVQVPTTSMVCTPVANYQSVFYNPKKVKADIALALGAIMNGLAGTYVPPGRGILKEAHYPRTTKEIGLWLDRLIEMDCDLTSDIEGYSLKAEKSHIATIAFAWDKHSGVAFACDWEDVDPETNEDGHHGRFRLNQEVRDLLADFFIRFKRKIIFHQITHDASVLIRHLFMRDLLDTEGLLNGLDTVLKNFDDTKLIAYLATNSCAGNQLGLKEQAKEFAGNWAEEDIKDIRRIPLPDLLEYNLIDVLATWHVREKYWDRMVNDDQLAFYETIFKPAVLDVVQMQLTGLPVNMEEVKRFETGVTRARDEAVASILSNPVIVSFNERLNEIWAQKRNERLKKKRVSAADGKEILNPNSNLQLQELFYEFLGFQVIDKTESGAPATGTDTLKKLMSRTEDLHVLSLIQAIIDYSSVDKIVTSFLPSLLNAVPGPDGWHYLFGSLNIGGTVSGRLSSSNPNLQNLPANSPWAKAFKACIQAPPGWLFCGLDFASLEDRISALTTRDSNKLKIYLEGYDGHSLRAFAYFGDQMPDIETAPDDSTACFRLTTASGEIHFHAEEDVTYLGQTMKGAELYDLLTRQGI